MPDEPAFDSAKYRQVLGHFPTGVTVVTASTDHGPVGMAVGSFASVSLEPPLVGFFAGKASSSWPRIRDAGSFCVNVLAQDQEDLSRVFASRGTDKFAGVGWHRSATGAPLLEGVLAWIDCDLDSVVDAGDHELALGRVRELQVAAETEPLVFYRGGYARLA